MSRSWKRPRVPAAPAKPGSAARHNLAATPEVKVAAAEAGPVGAKVAAAGWASRLGGCLSMTIRIALGGYLVVLAAAVLIAGVPQFFGWHTSVVASGSMRPTLDIGDVVVYRPLGNRPARVGDVVLVEAVGGAQETISHRVYSVSSDGVVATKGDANSVTDAQLVPRDRILGVRMFTLAKFGMPSIWLHDREWLPLASWLAGTLLAISLYLRRRPAGAPAAVPAGPPGVEGDREPERSPDRAPEPTSER